METQTINIRGEEIILTAHKAIYWVAEKALMLSDLHIGKSASFRKHGIAVPQNLEKDLNVLNTLLLKYEVAKVFILGDLFHWEENSEWYLFKEYLSTHPEISWHLILGNHDKEFLKSNIGINIHVHEQLVCGPFEMLHDLKNRNDSERFAWVGHVHPKYKLKTKARQTLILPCFYLQEDHGILPAFSSFTGGYLLDQVEGSTIYLIAKEKVIALK